MKSGQMTTKENELLADIDRWAKWLSGSDKKPDISLNSVQYTVFQSICEKVNNGAVDRMNYVANLDVNDNSYAGYKVKVK